MPKMKDRNLQLKTALGGLASKETIQEIKNIPKEDTVNRQGYAAYSLPDKLRLLTMLNTLKLQPQFYRTEDETMKELRDLIERLDPYFVAQAITYSRCMGDGMRSINHLAAAILAPLTKGTEWGKRFYGPFDRKKGKNGCIFRPDDMSEIKDVIYALGGHSLPSTVRNGFKSTIESLDTYRLAKYRKTIIDISNLVHPNPNNSQARVQDDNGQMVKTLDAIMKGITVSADTWEVAQSTAGQEVAKAVKEGKLTKEEAETVLSEAKADNWESLLKDKKLGIIAALRNIRNIMKNPRKEIIDSWCELISDEELIRKNLVLPIYFDLAYDAVNKEFHDYDCAPQVTKALQDAYIKSIPNLASVFTGKTCIMVDVSGSMGAGISDGKTRVGEHCQYSSNWRSNHLFDELSPTCCGYKAGLIAATIAKATGADVVNFGSTARFNKYDKNKNVFALAKDIGMPYNEGTYLHTAWELLIANNKKYDRIIIISDDEINSHALTSMVYKEYLRLCSPYVYVIDLAAYGTVPLAGDKVSFFFGYGSSLYEHIVKNEFNPTSIIDEVEKIVI